MGRKGPPISFAPSSERTTCAGAPGNHQAEVHIKKARKVNERCCRNPILVSSFLALECVPIRVIALSSVMPAHSASEDARERAYVAGIHVFCAPSEDVEDDVRPDRSLRANVPVPLGFLKQPTDSGSTCVGSQSTTFGKKIMNVIVIRKTP
jgi:hypothetical protein